MFVEPQDEVQIQDDIIMTHRLAPGDFRRRQSSRQPARLGCRDGPVPGTCCPSGQALLSSGLWVLSQDSLGVGSLAVMMEAMPTRGYS